MIDFFNCQNELDVVRCIKENPQSINKIRDFGTRHTPLSFYCNNGKFDVAQALLTYGANPINHTLERGAIQHAASKGHIIIVDFLIKFGININDTSDLEQKAPLHHAAINNHSILVEYLISDSNININIRDRFRMTPLMYACKNGNIEIVKSLLKNGANIELVDKDKYDAFFHACTNQNKDIIDILIFYGADISRNIGTTPLSLDIKHGRYSIVEKLLNIGCNIDEKIFYGDTPLVLSVKINNFQIFKLLLDKGANVEISDDTGMTSLHYAAKWGYSHIIESLINDVTFNMNKGDNTGKTALMLACKNNHIDIVDILLKAGANIYLTDNEGYDAICFSCMFGNLVIFNKLIDYFKISDVQDKLITIAREYENIDIIKRLAELTSTKLEPIIISDWNIFD